MIGPSNEADDWSFSNESSTNLNDYCRHHTATTSRGMAGCGGLLMDGMRRGGGHNAQDPWWWWAKANNKVCGDRLHDSDSTEATSLCIMPPEQQVCIYGVVRKPTSDKCWLDSPHVTVLVGERPRITSDKAKLFPQHVTHPKGKASWKSKVGRE